MLKKWFIIIISLGLLLVVQLDSLSPAFEKGSREGGSSEAEEHGGSVAETLERLVNFVIFAGILYVVLRKPLVNFLDNHAERIQKALKEAKELQEEAVQKAERYQTQLLSVEEEALKIKQEAEQEALGEKKKILAEAQMQAERLMNQVKFEVDQEVKKAKEELKTFAALLAVEIAQKKLRAGLTESDQQKLVEEYIARIGNLN